MNGSLEFGLKYNKVAQGENVIMRYVDANYAGNVDTSRSLSRYVIILFGTTIC